MWEEIYGGNSNQEKKTMLMLGYGGQWCFQTKIQYEIMILL